MDEKPKATLHVRFIYCPHKFTYEVYLLIEIRPAGDGVLGIYSVGPEWSQIEKAIPGATPLIFAQISMLRLMETGIEQFDNVEVQVYRHLPDLMKSLSLGNEADEGDDG